MQNTRIRLSAPRSYFDRLIKAPRDPEDDHPTYLAELAGRPTLDASVEEPLQNFTVVVSQDNPRTSIQEAHNIVAIFLRDATTFFAGLSLFGIVFNLVLNRREPRRIEAT